MSQEQSNGWGEVLHLLPTCFSCSFNSWGQKFNLDGSTATSWIESQVSISPFRISSGFLPKKRGVVYSVLRTIDFHRLSMTFRFRGQSEALARNFSSATCASESAEEASWRRSPCGWLEMVRDGWRCQVVTSETMEIVRSWKKTSRCCLCELYSLARQGTHPQVWSPLQAQLHPWTMMPCWSCRMHNSAMHVNSSHLSSSHCSFHIFLYFSHINSVANPIINYTLRGLRHRVFPWSWDDVR